MTNYDPTENPWNLDPPPEWVLRQLAVYDDQLVLLPGITEPLYRLARRSHAKLVPLVQGGEVQRMIRLGVVPVTSVKKNPNWFELFQWLKDHDIWANGGWEKVADQLDEFDQRQSLDTDERQLDDVGHLAAEAWFAKQLRSGEVTFVQGTTSPPVPSVDASRPAAPDHAEQDR